MTAKALASWMIAIFACVGSARAQEDNPKQETPELTKEFAERYNENFLERHPLVNTQLKDVSVFYESGQPVSTHTLRDSYTVLVFGCLT